MPLYPIDGSEGPDPINGGNRGELIRGLGGKDSIYSADGNDLVYAGADDDSVQGGYGNDRLFGEDGNDGMHGGWGNDRMYGGGGNDTFLNLEGPEQDSVWGGDGNDYAYFSQAGNGMFHGGRGVDLVAISSIAFGGDPVSVDISSGSGVFQSNGATITLTSVEKITVYGGTGADSVTGGRFRDIIQVYTGANEVDAGAGNDAVVYAADAANTLDGGAGNDLLYVAGTSFAPLEFTVTGGVVDDGRGSVITGFERFVVYGGGDNDSATTGDGDDRLYGNFGLDTLDGGTGNDRVFGQAGDDSLYGGNGDDTVVGGAGLDGLTGGAGRDVFRFVINDGSADAVTDFASGEDVLRIDRTAFGIAGSVTVVLSLDGPSGGGAQFVYRQSSGDLVWDADGDGAGTGVTIASLLFAVPLAAGDIVLG